MAVTVNATECWDLPALEEIRKSGGMAAVHAAMAVGDVSPGGSPKQPPRALWHASPGSASTPGALLD